MIRTGSLIALLISVVPAGAQPADQPQPDATLRVLLPYVGDSTFQTQLSLTPEQVKTLLGHRQKQWDEVYALPSARATKGAAERDAATVAAFKAVLKPEQLKRARQLAAQEVWGGPRFGSAADYDLTRVGAFVLNAYPEIAAALKLSDEQQKLVSALTAGSDPRFGGGGGFGGRGGRASVVYLTPAQTATAKALLGPIDEKTRRAEYDPRVTGGYSASSGIDALAELALVKDVRTHLALTQAQESELSALTNGGFGGGFGGGGRGRFRGGYPGDDSLSPAAQKKVTDIIDAEARVTLAAILKPEQLTRLEQINRRANDGPWGGVQSEVALYFQTDVEAALKYTPDQRKQFDTADAEYAAAVGKAVRSDAGFADTEKALAAAHANHDKAYAAVLTSAQSAKFKELVGEPFAGSTTTEQPGGGPPADYYRQYRESTFGRYLGDLSTVGRDKGLATELKLTEEQLKKLRYAAFELSEQFGGGGGGGGLGFLLAANEDATEFVKKSLTDILTPEQAKRFRQIALQLREYAGPNQFGPGGGFGGRMTVPSAVGYPGVAAEVKLTAEQKEKLIDGATPAEVLTPEQKTAIKAMLGEPYKDIAALAGRGGPGGLSGGGGGLGGRGRGFVPSPVALALPWDALKLSPDQAEKLALAANRYAFAAVPEPRPGGKGGFGGGPFGGGSVPPEKLTAAAEEFEKELAAILTAEQKAKIAPLALQQLAATSGLPAAFARPDVAKLVKLTADQSQQIAAAEADLRKLAGLVETAGLAFDKQQVALVALRDRLDARIVALLSDEQKKAWKELTGEPWPGFKKAG